VTTTADATLEATIKAACKELHTPTIAARAKELADDATRSKQTFLAYLWALLEAELDDRAERRRARRIREARFPRLKRLEDFSFDDAPQIPAATINELATCAFIDRAENAILLGESGTGKVISRLRSTSPRACSPGGYALSPPRPWSTSSSKRATTARCPRSSPATRASSC
jgi:DNA replication protein DnaC